MVKKWALVALFSLFSSTATATANAFQYYLPDRTEGWSQQVFEWGRVRANAASTVLSSNDATKRLVVESNIGYSSNGPKRVYFSVFYPGGQKTCTPVNTVPKKTVVKIDGQAVQAALWCRGFTDTELTYLEMTALSDAGNDYIIKKMGSEQGEVFFEMDTVVATLSNVGFKEVWAKESSKAL